MAFSQTEKSSIAAQAKRFVDGNIWCGTNNIGFVYLENPYMILDTLVHEILKRNFPTDYLAGNEVDAHNYYRDCLIAELNNLECLVQ